MIFTFSVDTGDSPEAAKAVIDAVTKVTIGDVIHASSPEWTDLVERTEELLDLWSDKLTTVAGSWADWMTSR